MKNTNYINGKWVPANGEEFQSFDKSDQREIWQGNSSNQSDVDSAVQSSLQSLESWKKTSIVDRIEFIKKFQELLKENKSALALTLSKDNGKPLWESGAEIQSMISKVDASLRAQQERRSDVITQMEMGQSAVRYRSIGVMAVFGPYNFPGHLPNGHIVPALIAGNTIVYKPSELTPLISEKIVQLWEKSGLPPGVINLIQGSKETGIALSKHKSINGVLFTGSYPTGKAIHQSLAGRPEVMLALEMGGNNPLIAHEVADVESAVFNIIQSSFITSGQRCTCARRLYLVDGEDSDNLLNKLVDKVEKIRIGFYKDDPEPFMGPVITNHQANILLQAQDNLINNNGANPLIAMKLLKNDSGLLSPGILDLTNSKNIEDEENFGPLLQVYKVKNFEEAISAANNTKYGLSAGILTDRRENFDRFYNEAKAGIINWNSPTTGAKGTAPFGGVGASGNYRPSAFHAADYCSYPISSIEKPKQLIPDSLPKGLDKAFK